MHDIAFIDWLWRFFLLSFLATNALRQATDRKKNHFCCPSLTARSSFSSSLSNSVNESGLVNILLFSVERICLKFPLILCTNVLWFSHDLKCFVSFNFLSHLSYIPNRITKTVAFPLLSSIYGYNFFGFFQSPTIALKCYYKVLSISQLTVVADQPSFTKFWASTSIKKK